VIRLQIIRGCGTDNAYTFLVATASADTSVIGSNPQRLLRPAPLFYIIAVEDSLGVNGK